MAQNLTEFKKSLDNAYIHGLTLTLPVVESGVVFFAGPVPLGISMILRKMQ